MHTIHDLTTWDGINRVCEAAGQVYFTQALRRVFEERLSRKVYGYGIVIESTPSGEEYFNEGARVYRVLAVTAKGEVHYLDRFDTRGKAHRHAAWFVRTLATPAAWETWHRLMADDLAAQGDHVFLDHKALALTAAALER